MQKHKLTLPKKLELGPPNWDALYETAAAQEGYFTLRQAAGAGYSPQLLIKHLKSGKLHRARRGMYRLAHFPPGEHEDLVTIWLWSEQAGVFSHETALALHELSDAMPALVHLTLPSAFRSWSRRHILEGVVLYFDDVKENERAWMGPIPLTSPLRTLDDCIRANVSPEFVVDAAEQAVKRGLIGLRSLIGLLYTSHKGPKSLPKKSAHVSPSLLEPARLQGRARAASKRQVFQGV
jgi:predicted transcriptional regulator of viral defense system